MQLVLNVALFHLGLVLMNFHRLISHEDVIQKHLNAVGSQCGIVPPLPCVDTNIFWEVTYLNGQKHKLFLNKIVFYRSI